MVPNCEGDHVRRLKDFEVVNQHRGSLGGENIEREKKQLKNEDSPKRKKSLVADSREKKKLENEGNLKRDRKKRRNSRKGNTPPQSPRPMEKRTPTNKGPTKEESGKPWEKKV